MRGAHQLCQTGPGRDAPEHGGEDQGPGDL